MQLEGGLATQRTEFRPLQPVRIQNSNLNTNMQSTWDAARGWQARGGTSAKHGTDAAMAHTPRTKTCLSHHSAPSLSLSLTHHPPHVHNIIISFNIHQCARAARKLEPQHTLQHVNVATGVNHMCCAVPSCAVLCFAAMYVFTSILSLMLWLPMSPSSSHSAGAFLARSRGTYIQPQLDACLRLDARS